MSKILVVEDEPDVVLLYRLILESDGHEVLAAEMAEDAFRLLEREVPDAVLLDIRLPGVDGWAVLDWLRDRDLMRRLPVVAVSAHTSKETQERARAMGCREWMAKPFSRKELLTVLANVTRGRGEKLEG